MSLAVVRSRAPAAGRAPEVTVEVHLANGLPSFSIVGLPDLEVRESRERVRAALQNCGFDFPVRRITITSRPPICRKNPVVSICLSRSASSPRAGKFRPNRCSIASSPASCR
ncbi:hypothetical protein QFZ97_003045 [Paraburkholderia youngii]